MRFRGRSVRRKITALLLVPLLSLVALWAFVTALTAGEVRQLLAVSSVSDHLGKPAEAVVHALQQERRETLVYLADPRSTETALAEARQTTDTAVAEIRRNADGGARDDLHSSAVRRLDTMVEGLDRLDALRQQVDANTVTRSGALEAYNNATEPGLQFQSALHLLENVELDRHGRAVVGLSHAAEYLARSDALVAGALAAGRMTEKEARILTEGTAERRLSYNLHLPDLPSRDRQAHESFWEISNGQTLVAAEEAVLTHGAEGMQAGRWREINELAHDDLRQLATNAGDRYQDAVDPAANAILIRAVVAGLVGLLAVLVTIVVSVRVGRGLARDLRTLWREARESAEVRLPSVMRRLGEGERVDVETEVPRLEYGRDEVGQVGQALNTLQRAAVEAAVQQAEMRRGVSEVFVNLARRNQVLLHRQLSLLDTMERRTEDADELADLFRLDHLTTRMRRHAEGLVILSGAAPARQWRKPVLLMDVVRAAVAEVEDYERVELRRLPPLAVSGNVVADLTHLIAELIENATQYSPPHTAVQVQGEQVPQGFSLEIHDRGLGMTSDALASANHRLAETPDFKLSDTDRLGLFVVSRLAERHQVRIALKRSPYGGTTAVVLLPGHLLSEAVDGVEERSPLPERPAPPALLNGPVDGPVELEAPVNSPGLDSENLLDPADGGAPGPVPARAGVAGGREPSGAGSADGVPADHAEAYRPGRGSGRHRAPDAPVPFDAPVPGDPPFAYDGPAPSEGHAGPYEAAAAAVPRGRPVTGDDEGVGHDEGAGHDAAGGEIPALPQRRRRSPVLVAENGRQVRRVPTEELHPASPEEQRRAAGAHPAPATDSGGPRPSPSEEAGARENTAAGLPRRVRQAGLAPQLRPTGRGGARRETLPEPAPDVDAEEVRARMSSLQRGWLRGREHNESRTGENPPGTDVSEGRER